MPPQRIISLVPSQTELLFHLGLADRIVGLTRFCIHPAEGVRPVVKVGGTKNPELDRIRSLAPDWILANKEENRREDVETLAAEFSLHLTDVNTLDEALAMIEAVGAICGVPDRAGVLAAQIRESFAALPVPKTRPRVAYFIWRNPWMVAAGDTFIDAMLEVAGFTNAFADRNRYPVVTETELQEARPEVILLSSEPYPFREKHFAELADICPGVPVELVDGELFSWYGSRLLASPAYFRELQNRLGVR